MFFACLPGKVYALYPRLGVVLDCFIFLIFAPLLTLFSMSSKVSNRSVIC